MAISINGDIKKKKVAFKLHWPTIPLSWYQYCGKKSPKCLLKLFAHSLALFKMNILCIVFCRDIRWALLLGLIHITTPVHLFTSGSDTDGPCWHFYLLLFLFQWGSVESLISGLSCVLQWSVQVLPSSFYIFSDVVTWTWPIYTSLTWTSCHRAWVPGNEAVQDVAVSVFGASWRDVGCFNRADSHACCRTRS